MRITSNMMINNAKYWLSKQTEKLNDVETTVASGKKVNKPSDDPEASAQILELRATLSKYEQHQSNMDQAINWIEAAESTLDAVDSLLQDALDIVLEEASGEFETRESALETLNSIYNQLISLAQTKYGSNYMYSGNQTETTPFSDTVSISGSVAQDIQFDLTEDAANITIEITDLSGDVVRTMTVAAGVEGTNTITWDGLDNSGDPLPEGEYSFSVNATDSEGETVAAYSSYRGNSGTKQVIIGKGRIIELNRDGGAIFSEALGAIAEIITYFNGSNSDDTIVTDVKQSLNNSIDRAASERVALANIFAQLEISNERLDQLTLLVEKRITDLETGDLTEAAVELQAQETAYEVTQEAVAKVLKLPKLSDYI